MVAGEPVEIRLDRFIALRSLLPGSFTSREWTDWPHALITAAGAPADRAARGSTPPSSNGARANGAPACSTLRPEIATNSFRRAKAVSAKRAPARWQRAGAGDRASAARRRRDHRRFEPGYGMAAAHDAGGAHRAAQTRVSHHRGHQTRAAFVQPIAIFRGWACFAFGSVSVNTPSSRLALIFS